MIVCTYFIGYKNKQHNTRSMRIIFYDYSDFIENSSAF